MYGKDITYFKMATVLEKQSEYFGFSKHSLLLKCYAVTELRMKNIHLQVMLFDVDYSISRDGSDLHRKGTAGRS
jgi:hypothetical protein